MSEFLPQQNAEFDRGEAPLNRGEILNRLQEIGIDIELADLEGEDDNDVLGIIATYASMYNFEIEEVVRYVTPIEEWED